MFWAKSKNHFTITGSCSEALTLAMAFLGCFGTIYVVEVLRADALN